MTNSTAYTPTPQELSETVKSMTISQKMQLDAILSMVTALLVSVHQAAQPINKQQER